jgi:hypothetical protein
MGQCPIDITLKNEYTIYIGEMSTAEAVPVPPGCRVEKPDLSGFLAPKGFVALGGWLMKSACKRSPVPWLFIVKRTTDTRKLVETGYCGPFLSTFQRTLIGRR